MLGRNSNAVDGNGMRHEPPMKLDTPPRQAEPDRRDLPPPQRQAEQDILIQDPQGRGDSFQLQLSIPLPLLPRASHGYAREGGRGR